MDASRREEVVRLATEVGVAESLFEGWDGGELALYQGFSGRSRDLAVARALAKEKAERGDWILDIGSRAFSIRGNQGDILKAKLDAAGITYASGDQMEPFLKRTRWAVREYKGLLDELAKR